MFKKALLKIGSTVIGGSDGLTTPSTYEVQTSDIDLDDKRSMSGYLNRNRIRSNVYTLSLSWDRLEWSELIEIVNASSASKFTVRFLDAIHNGYVTKDMYRDANMSYKMYNIDSDGKIYWTLDMSLVEY